MEERDASGLKLVLCGSYIGQMERLLTGPLRGRLTGLLVEPLGFAQSAVYMEPEASALEMVERYAVAGGMSLYLDELGRGGTLRQRVCARVLDPRGPLFNDPREVLEEELRSPGVYYSLLQELSSGRKSLADLAAALGRRTRISRAICERCAACSGRQARAGHRPGGRAQPPLGAQRRLHALLVPFCVSIQEDLKTGLAPGVLYRKEIEPQLADHVSPTLKPSAGSGCCVLAE